MKNFQLGGTIGDIESMPFVAAFEKFQRPAFKDQLMTGCIDLQILISV